MNIALRRVLISALAAQVLSAFCAAPSLAYRLDGFNVISVPGHPFGSPSAKESLLAAKRVGATTLAIIPFLWQSGPESPTVQRGTDMSDEELRLAIRDARALGFVVIIKPHVWIPGHWAGAVEPKSEEDWRSWFDGYRGVIERLARIAAEEQADMFAIGNELVKTTRRPEWISLIAALRDEFPGKLLYFAHDIEEAEAVPFWNALDMIGVTLYPTLGADDDRAGRRLAMRAVAKRLDALSNKIQKPVLVGEVGLRSAVGASARPWESAEERTTPAAPKLQADVLSDWLSALDGPSINGVLIWRWFTDPAAGGLADTDFTVQGKPAEKALMCAWTVECKSP